MFKVIIVITLFFSCVFFTAKAKQMDVNGLDLLQPNSTNFVFSHPKELTLNLIHLGLKNDNLKRKDLKFMESYFDFPLIAEFTINGVTEKFNQKQQEEFENVFMEYQRLKLILKIKDLSQEDIKFKHMRFFPEKKIAIVSFYSITYEKSFNLDFYTKTDEQGSVKIFDVHVEDTSILLALQSEVAFLIAENGLEKTISYFKEVLDKEKSALYRL